jgi:hypothetical protein
MFEIVTLPSGQKIEIYKSSIVVRIYLYDKENPRTFTWGVVARPLDYSHEQPVTDSAHIVVWNQTVAPERVAAFVEILQYAQQLAAEMDKQYPRGMKVDL